MNNKKLFTKFSYIKYNFLLLILLTIFHFAINAISIGEFPYVKRLLNGNYIILSSGKICFADNTLQVEYKSYDIDTDGYQEDNITSSSVSQFKESDDGYIIAILFQTIFIFSPSGNHKCNTTKTFIIPKFATPIIPYKKSANNHYFTIIYGHREGDADDCSYLSFIKGNYDSSSNTLSFEDPVNFYELSSYLGTNSGGKFKSTISCDIMKNNSKEYIACLYGNDGFLIVSIFDQDTYAEIAHQINTEAIGYYFKLVILPEDREKGIFCTYRYDGLKCLKYNIKSNAFYDYTILLNSGCGYRSFNLIMEYFYETEQFIVGCKGYSSEFYMSKATEDLEFIKVNNKFTEQFTSDSSGRVNIVLPYGQTSYGCFVYPGSITTINVTVEIINTYSIVVVTEPLECEHYYSYNRTVCLEDIPQGYFCNSTTDKTIDKCHENCKTCKSAPTNNNNSCTSCRDEGTNYFNLGNCVPQSDCIYGYFQDNSINKCTCLNDKACLLCTPESLQEDSCIGCNNQLYYFAKKSDIDNNNLYYKCYNESTIGEGYYLNSSTFLYESCYHKCSKCKGPGNDDENNCTVCKPGSSLITNKIGKINCYTTCDNYIYFDQNNNYHCEENCPSTYKTIVQKKKCIENCALDNDYPLEYNNKCYQNCPIDTNISSENPNKCELKCERFGKYYNLQKTECITRIEDGYYCDNQELKTIAKCHDNCKRCESGGNDEMNNCLECPETGTDKIYFYLGNCLSSSQCDKGSFEDENHIKKCICMKYDKCLYCSSESIVYGLCEICNTGYHQKIDDTNIKNSFVECYNSETIDLGYYLNEDTNYYEPCFSSCEKCEDLGNANEHKCTKCKANYSFRINDNDKKNCYKDCDYYFYFDDSGEYQCTLNNSCPQDYKLILGEGKCIKNCAEDKIFNHTFEYNNVCFIECPDKTHISSTNEKLCEAELICNKYYNYNQTDCIESIPEGFYCNSTELKTIDKCHENCKSCSTGPSSSNNKCDTCKDSGTKFFDLGNCRDSCQNGNFIDPIDSVEKCKCTANETCFYCTEESNQKNLCVSCNTLKGYYPKSDDEPREDNFINCYKDPEGYFLKDDKYEPCFNSCKSCDALGNSLDNKCKECKIGYQIKNDNDTDKNCYEECSVYYYDSENKYKCIQTNNCPGEYSILISAKGRCIDDCRNDNIYQFEYNDDCLAQCPPGTEPNSENKCKEIVVLNCESNGQYYNYNRTECINSIPPGYYCDNETLRTIEKCHENCQTCESGGNDENNNCLTCKTSGKIYIYLGNCFSESECPNGVFVDDDSIKRCKCSIDKCKYCNETSLSNNACISCNTQNGYYPKSDDNNIDYSYINCYKNPEGYFLKNEKYEPCYSSCKFCTEYGNETDNKCTECKSEFEFKNDYIGNNNCYQKCSNNYYYDESNNLHCTNDNKCPDGYSKYIKEKNRCINNCQNDNIYKYEYQGICYDICPSGTVISNSNSYLCEKQIEDDCKLIEKALDLYDEEIILENDINSLTVNYISEFGPNRNNFVSKSENEFFRVYSYKNITCLNNLANEATQIDFKNCYTKVINELGITEDLLITIINVNKDMKKPDPDFYFSYPLTGKIINITGICTGEVITKNEDVQSIMEQKLDEKKEEFIYFLTNQGIDVFNLSDRFYTDMCFYYESPNGRDVPMKDRIASFYPNITLCDEGCDNKGVDLQTMKAKCECIFNSFKNKDFMDNLYGQAIAEVIDVISSLNIAVVQCIKEILNKERFTKCIGGYFILALLFGESLCFIKYIIDGLYNIRKYIFSLTESFNIYMKRHPSNSPPKKSVKSKTMRVKRKINIDNNYSSQSSQSNLRKQSRGTFIGKKKSKFLINSEKFELNEKEDSLKNKRLLKKNNSTNISKFTNKHVEADKYLEEANSELNRIRELLTASFDEEDFDDVINSDQRKFCDYFKETFKSNQIFVNAFCIHEILRPRSLKLLILIMTIELYFVINALFYNEEYLSELFNSEEKDSFFSFVPRRFNQFVYTYAVSGIISYLIGYFFVEEEKLKRIFIRNKEDNMKLKYELSVLMKDIKNRFIGLIFLSIFLSIICFVYISCFNIVYPYIREEWIKSSIFVLLLMQFINFLLTFLHCSLRYIAIRYNSEKIFRLSVLLA